MTFDGVTAVQSRIAQIQQLVTGTTSGVGGTSAPEPAATSAQTPEFASLLADAMATDTTQSDPLSDSSSDDSDSSIGGIAMVSQLLQLAQLESGSSLGTSGLSSLASDPTFAALGGGTSSGLSSLATDPTLAALGGGTSSATGLGATGTADTSLDSLLAAVDPSALTTTATTSPANATSTPNAVTQAFLNNALSQQGKPYVYGATALTSDPNPPAFDCSELTKWAAARAGDPIPDGATAQYLYIRDHGDTMSVQQALHTPGALLFHFSHEPKNLGDIPADGHVAISLGDGVHTMEARGHAYGTNVFDNAAGQDFNFAGVIPGMN